MDLSAIIRAVFTSKGDLSFDSVPELRPGLRLTGRVLKLESDGRALIDLGRFRALAQISFGVKPGQTLQLKVVEGGPELHLKADPSGLTVKQPALTQLSLDHVLDGAHQKLQLGQNLTGRILKLESDGRALIDLGRFRALAPVSSAMKPGQTVQLNVVEGGLKPHQKADPASLTTKQSALPQLGLDQVLDEAGQKLQPGQRLNGRVLKLESDGRAIIDLGRFRALAQIPSAAKPGQTVQLHLVQGGPELRLKADAAGLTAKQPAIPLLNMDQVLDRAGQLKLLDMADKIAGGLKMSNVPGPVPETVHRALGQIKTAFESLPIERPPQNLAPWLRSAVEERGMLFEKRLADAVITTAETHPEQKTVEAPRVRAVIAGDLKANLMVLKNFFEVESPHLTDLLSRTNTKDMAFLRQSVNRLLGHVEQQQERAGARQGDGAPFQVFAHMLPIKDQTMPVRIKVYYPKKRRHAEGEQQRRVALLLDMDHLGAVRADLAMMENELGINFFVRDDDVRIRFEKETETVATALAGSFTRVRISTIVSHDKIARFDDEDQAGTPMGRIDIKA